MKTPILILKSLLLSLVFVASAWAGARAASTSREFLSRIVLPVGQGRGVLRLLLQHGCYNEK